MWLSEVLTLDLVSACFLLALTLAQTTIRWSRLVNAIW